MAQPSQHLLEALEARVLLSGDGLLPVNDAHEDLGSQLLHESAIEVQLAGSLESAADAELGSGDFLESNEELAASESESDTSAPDGPLLTPRSEDVFEAAVPTRGAVNPAGPVASDAYSSRDAEFRETSSGETGAGPGLASSVVTSGSTADLLVQTLHAANAPPADSSETSATGYEIRPRSSGRVGLHDVPGNQVANSTSLPNIGVINGAEVWSGTESYLWDLRNAEGTEGAQWDILKVTGNSGTLTINATANPGDRFLLDITGVNAAGAIGAVTGFDATKGYSWRILHTESGILGFNRESFNLSTAKWTAGGNALGSGGFVLDQSSDGKDLILRFIPTLPVVTNISLSGPVPTLTELGPDKITGNLNTRVPPDNSVIGAINEVVVHAGKPGVAFLGSVNGGVWKSTDFDTATPTWTPVSEQLVSLAISDLSLSPYDADGVLVGAGTNASKLVLFAGTGSLSSAAGRGGSAAGMFRSKDGGTTWQEVGNFTGLRVTSVVTSRHTANLVLAATVDLTKTVGAVEGRGGLYLSPDNGDHWYRLSGKGTLPEVDGSDLVEDPSTAGRFYVALATQGPTSNLQQGIWRTDNATANPASTTITFTRFATGMTLNSDTNGVDDDGDGTVDEAGEGIDEAGRIRLAASSAGAGESIYAALIATRPTINGGNDLALTMVFRTVNQGGTWTQVPAVPVNSAPPVTNPTGQGYNHFAIAVDPTNPATVFVAGAVNGVSPYLGIAFRFDGTGWTQITANNGVATGPGPFNSAPHGDFRRLIFTQNGQDLIAVSDGGIYRLKNPRVANATPVWEFIGGGLRISEFSHSIAYDRVQDAVFGGLQDNAIVRQTGTPNTWTSMYEYGDGNFMAVDYDPAQPTQSVRYFMSNNFQSFFRQVFTGIDSFQVRTTLLLKAVGNATAYSGLDNTLAIGGSATDFAYAGFTHIPFATNAAAFNRLLIGRAGLYESLDGGNTLQARLVDTPNPTNFVSAVAYGGFDGAIAKPGVVFVARAGQVAYRADISDDPSQQFHVVNPAGAVRINRIILDPTNWKEAYALDNGHVWKLTVKADGSLDSVDITGNLKFLTKSFEALEVVPKGDKLALVVGAAQGVFRLDVSNSAAIDATQWASFGMGLPRVAVTDIQFDERNPSNPYDDVLIFATLGRGAWRLENAANAVLDQPQLRIEGTAGDDVFTLRIAAPSASKPLTLEVLSGSGSPTLIASYPLASVTSVLVHTQGGNDQLIIDSTNGELILEDDITFDGGSDTGGVGDRLTFQGPVSSDLMTRQEGLNNEIEVRQLGWQIVHAVNVETYDQSTTLESIYYFFRNIWNHIVDFFTADEVLDQNLPLLGDNLGGALDGEPGLNPAPVGQPLGPTSKAPRRHPSESPSSFMRRVFESGNGGFRISDVGTVLLTEAQVESALDALDPFAGNVDVQEAAKTITLGNLAHPFTRSINLELPLDVELLGGAIKLQGDLQLTADIEIRLAMGVDAHGFYIRTDATPEIAITNLQVNGKLTGVGDFGFLRVEIKNATLATDNQLKITLDLQEGVDPYGLPSDNKLRVYEIGANLTSLFQVGFSGSPAPDLTFTTKVAVAVGPDGDAPFSLGEIDIGFIWDDITDLSSLRIDTAGNPAADFLMRFLNIGKGDFLDGVLGFVNSLGKLDQTTVLNTEIPFTNGFKLGDAFDFAEGFLDKIYLQLVDICLVGDLGAGHPGTDLAKGRLSDDAEFQITVGNRLDFVNATPVKVKITKASTVANNSIGDLVIDINNALTAKGLGTKVKATVVRGDVQLCLLSGASIRVDGFDSASVAATELGFASGQTGVEAPKFRYLQDLLEQLETALDPPGPATLDLSVTYEQATKSLLFGITFEASVTHEASFKGDTDLGLGELAELAATGKFSITAGLAFGGKLGIEFGSINTPKLMSSFLVPAPATGKLTSAAAFEIVLNDGELRTDITLNAPDYAGNNSIADLVADLNSKLSLAPQLFQGQPLIKVLRFVQSGTSIHLIALNETDVNNDGVLDLTEDTNGDGIRQIWLDKVNAISINADPGNTAVTELGFTPGGFARSLIKGVFVQDLALSGTLTVSAVGLGAKARFGVFSLETSGGTATGTATVSLALKNPLDASTRIDVSKMFGDIANISNYIAPGASFTGSLSISLKNIQVKPALFDPFPAASAVTLFIPDIKSLAYNPNPYDALSNNLGIFVTYPDLHGLGDFNCLTFLDVVNALDGLADQLEGMKGFGFLSQPIPLINISIGDILDFASDLADAIQGLASGDGATLKDIETAIESAIGLGPDVLTLSVEHAETPVIAAGVATFNPSGPKNALRFTGPNGAKIKFVADTGSHLTAETNTAASDWNAVDKILTIYFNAGYTTAATVDALTDKGGTTISVDNVAEPGSGPGAINTTVLKLKLAYSLAYGNFLPLQLSLGDLAALLPAGPVKDALVGITDFVQIEGSANINVTASADLSFELGIDVSNPCDWIPFVEDAGTHMSLNAAVRGTDLDFKIALGGLGIFVKDGTVTLDGDGDPLTTNDNATFGVGLTDNNGDGRHYFRSSETWFDSSNLGITLSAQASARLPLYFPSASLPAGGSATDGPDANTYPDNWLTIDIINLSNLFDSLIHGTPLPNGILTINTPNLASLFDDFNVCDLITNSSLLLDGLDTFLGSIQSALSAEVFDRDLPLVGDKLGKAADVIGEFREGLLADLREKLAEVGDPIGLVKEAIFKALGKPGIDILTKADGTVLTSADQIDIQCTEDAVTFNLRLKKAVALVDTSDDPINFDIGIPGFGLKVDGNVKVEVGFDFKLKFAISASNGFYFDTSDSEELRVEFKVTIPGLHASGQLLFLQLDVSDEADGKDAQGNDRAPSSFAGYFSVNIRDPVGSGNRLTFADLLSSGVEFDDIIESELGARAELNLDFAVSFAGDAKFPRLIGEFDLDWEWTLGGDGAGDLEFGFHNIQIDIGSFISEFIQPILNEIKKVTEPFQPLIDVITAPIPILSDIFGEPVTMLDLAEMSGYLSPSTVKFINAVTKIIDLANSTSFSNGSILIPLGDFNLDVDTNGNVNRKAGDPNPSPTAMSEKTTDTGAKSFLKDLEDLGFTFPFLSISEIFKLFMGKPISIVEYHMPVFEFTASIDFQIPIYPPLYAVFGGTIGAKIDLTFGFDTYGLQKFLASDDKNPLDIFDGFYVKDVDDNGNEVTEFTLSGGITAGAEVSVGFAEFGVRGGLFAEIGFDLNDPDNDGKVRVSELVALAMEDVRCIFDIHGRLYVALEAYLKINLLLFSIDEVWRFGEITLAEFDLVCPQPVLADVDGNGPGTEPSGGPGVLTLHMGEYADQREHGNTSDGAEYFSVVHIDGDPTAPDGETVEVSFNGIKQTYFGVKSIIVKAGAGNDKLDLRGVRSAANVHGGSGNDTLYAGRAVNGNKFYGDDGNDVIIGEEAEDTFGGANDEFHGGSGEDTLTGNEGNDSLYGDEGEDVLEGNAGDDTLEGGSGNDKLYGAEGADTIRGGDGADEIEGADDGDKLFGDGGNDRILGGAGSDWIIGGEGDDLIDAGLDDDIVLGDLGTIVSLLKATGIEGKGNDVISGGAGHDTLFGADGDDQIYGGAFLESGTSSPTAIDGRDFIDAGLGNDLVFADDAHSSQATVMPGGTVGDLVWFDFNQNGIRDQGDNGIAGVKIELHLQDNTLVAATTSNATGAFKFTGLLANQYYLVFFKPTGLQFTDSNQGSDDEVDSDANTVTGRSPVFELVSGGSNLTVDAGYKGSLPTISIDSVSAYEGDSGISYMTFTVSLSNPYSDEVSVCYKTSTGSGDGDAKRILDYDTVDWTLIFAPGETQKKVLVPIHGDLIDELNEVYSVELCDPNHGVIDATHGVGTGTIIDDDDAPVVSILDGEQITALDPIPEVTPITFRIRLSNPSYQPISIDWRTQQIVETDGTLKEDSARAFDDYDDTHEYNPATITFNPGQVERVITIATKSDALDEFNERFNVVLAINAATPSDGATLGDATGEGIIADDDLEPFVRIKTLTPQPVDEGHAGKRIVRLEVSLDAPSGRTVTVQWNTAHGTALGSPTPTDPADYVYKFETLKFVEGVTQLVTTVEVIGDTRLEPNEDFYANLLGAVHGRIDTNILAFNNNHARIEIANDEVPDPGPWYVEFSDAIYDVTEGQSVTITLVRAEGSSHPTAVYWSLGKPAAGTATPGLDYTDEFGAAGIWENGKPGAAARGIVHFGEGETTKTFVIRALSDSLYEGTEVALLALANPTGGATRAPQRFAALRIHDAQKAPTLAIDDPTITEGDAGFTNITFSVKASVDTGVTTTQPISVKWTTFNATALAGVDFVADSALLNIPTFTTTTTGTFTVKVVGDVTAELQEKFLVRLTDAIGAEIADYEGTATLLDNDRQTITGFVFNDLNGNGFFDSGTEYGLTGAKVTVKDSSGALPVVSTTNGVWSADVLLGNIVVTVDETTTPANSECTTHNNPLSTAVTPTVITTKSIGFMVQPTKGKGTGNTASGSRGNNDTAYGGGGNDLIDGGNGDDWLIGGHWIGPGCACTGDPYDATLKNQDEAAGGHRYVDPASLPNFGVIRGHVWRDSNGNGIQDELVLLRALKSVQVNLFDEGWNLVAITYTDASGNYAFNKVAPCNYYVQFLPPAEFRFSPKDAGANLVDSDADALTGLTDIVAVNGNTVTLDAGMVFVPNSSTGPWAIYFDHIVYSVRESDGFATITLRRVENSIEPVAVYFTRDGDIHPATLADPDYSKTQGTVSFGAGESEISFVVPVVNDTKTEGYEVVLLLLKDPTGGDVKGRPNTARLLIFDNPCPDDDEIHGHDGNDILMGDFGYFTNAGTPELLGGLGNDTLYGEDGDDRMFGEGGDDTFIGGAGNDQLDGGGENDIFKFDGDLPSGLDTIAEALSPFGGNDTIDLSATTGFAMTFDLGSVVLQSPTPSLQIQLPAGNVIENVTGGSRNDILKGNGLDNILKGLGGDDILEGYGGNDKLHGGTGDDTYLFDADLPLGHDDLFEGANADLDRVDFSATTTQPVRLNLDSLSSQLVSATLTLKLHSKTGIEELYGGAQDDVLLGNARDNFIQGGAGSDTLDGGDGYDVLIENRAGNFQLIAVDAVTGQLTLGAEVNTFSLASFEEISLVGDDTPNVLDASAFNGKVRLDGRGGDDVLLGGTGINILTGGEGNDQITGLGHTTLIEQRDADMVLTPGQLKIGATEVDTLAGITVAKLTGGDSANLLDASGFNLPGTSVVLNGVGGNDVLIGSPGDDTLIGGSGDDSLSGRLGDDTYWFITNQNLGSDTLVELAGQGSDTLDFTGSVAGVAVNLGVVTVQSINANLSLALSSMDSFENVRGGNGGDRLIGNAVSNQIWGGPGDDDLTGLEGADRFDGGLGKDRVLEEADFNMVLTNLLLAIGLQVDDLASIEGAVLIGGASNNILDASGFTLGGVTLEGRAGADILRGSTRNDRLIGGAGNDDLRGGTGSDTYVFDADEVLGSDIVNDSGGVADTLDFSETTGTNLSVDLAQAALQLIAAGRLLISLTAANSIENVIGGDGDDSIKGNGLGNVLDGGNGNDTIEGFAGSDILIGGDGNDTFRFDADFVLGNDVIREGVGSGGVDTLDFSATSASITVDLQHGIQQVVVPGRLTLRFIYCHNIENIIGGSGDDVLTGNSLENSLEGGPGNDTLAGKDGDDRYVFDADVNLGSDTLLEQPDSEGGIDTLDYSSTNGVPLAVNLGLNLLQVVAATHSLDLDWPVADVLAGFAFENLLGGNASDVLTGNTRANHIEGNGGNDTINAGLGDDTLVGGAGNDLLAGGTGDDTFVFDADGLLGDDTLVELGGAGTDLLDFSDSSTGVSINLNLPVLQVVNANLRIQLNGSQNFENVRGGSGNDQFTSNTRDNRFEGGKGDDTYVFDGDSLNGSDTVIEAPDATGGKDTLDFSSTTGFRVVVNLGLDVPQAVVLDAGPPIIVHLTLTLYSGESVENVVGGALNDILVGNALDNRLTGGLGKDLLQGRDGVDAVVEQRDADMVLTNTELTIGAETDKMNSIETAELTGGASVNKLHAGAFTLGPVIFDGGLGSDLLTGSTSLEDRVMATRDADMTLENTFLKIGVEVDTLVNIEHATLRGGAGANTLDASAFSLGGVLLEGGANSDTLRGGLKDDILMGGPGSDSLFGGAGIDTLVEERDANMTLTDAQLIIGAETDSLLGIERAELTGGAGGNLINATAVTTMILKLNGAGGGDVLRGGAMNDVLIGGAGDDFLRGGAGNDQYLFGDDWGTDTLVEGVGEGDDRVNFSNALKGIVAHFGPSLKVTESSNLLTVSSATIERFIASTGDDSVFVIPNAAVLLFVDGGQGDNDVLKYDSQAVLTTETPGTLTTVGFQPVKYSGIETVQISNSAPSAARVAGFGVHPIVERVAAPVERLVSMEHTASSIPAVINSTMDPAALAALQERLSGMDLSRIARELSSNSQRIEIAAIGRAIVPGGSVQFPDTESYLRTQQGGKTSHLYLAARLNLRSGSHGRST